MRKASEMAGYYRFVERAYDAFRGSSGCDWGLMTPRGSYPLAQVLSCGHNPASSSHSRQDRECGRCVVCRRLRAGRVLSAVRAGMLSPSVHSHWSVTLALPKWPSVLPSPDGNGSGSPGELFYVTPSLFRPTERVGLELNRVLSGLRRAAVAAVQDCFPGLKLGAFVGLHLADDWMSFRPHVHMVLCGTMLAGWPLDPGPDGSFPGLAGAWRTGLGGRRGLSRKVFERKLLEAWAARLGEYASGMFVRFRRAFGPLETRNFAYRFLGGMDERGAEAAGLKLGAAVLADPACVDVKRLRTNLATGDEDPEGALELGLRYAMAPAFARVDFRDMGAGMVGARFLSRKDGEWKPCGPNRVLFRRMLQACSVSRLRAYERVGFYATGRNKQMRRDLVARMNEGYPGGKGGGGSSLTKALEAPEGPSGGLGEVQAVEAPSGALGEPTGAVETTAFVASSGPEERAGEADATAEVGLDAAEPLEPRMTEAEELEALADAAEMQRENEAIRREREKKRAKKMAARKTSGLMSVEDAAAYAGRPKRDLREARERGELRGIKRMGPPSTRWRFAKGALDDYLKRTAS